MNSFALLSVLYFAAAICVPVAAQVDGESSRKTLAGLMAFSVLVEEIDEDAQDDGLSDRAIQADVERALRKAGIEVVSEDASTRDTPIFYVAVLTNKNENGLYGFAVLVRVLQRVRLARDTSVSAFATTWEAIPVVGTVGPDNVERLRGEVLLATSDFIEAHGAANHR